MNITVRLLQDEDKLEMPHWPVVDARPNKYTTLIAIDKSGKIRGISWMAYGGPVGMIVIWLHADPPATIPLAMESVRFSQACGCKMMLTHVIEDSRLLKVLTKRGWTINNQFKSVAIGKSIL